MPPRKDDEAFIRITNEDVWRKLNELERKVDSLNIKLYAFAGAMAIVAAFLGITGGVRLG